MPTRQIGSRGFVVGAVGLGCMGMSWAYDSHLRDDAASADTIRAALDAGVTLIDTADAYGPFTNERLVGRALAGRRDEAVVATKCGLVAQPDGTMVREASPAHIVAACDASLRRLGVDVIDLYQLHRVDPGVPVEESWGAMGDLVHAGKVRAIGLSEVGVDVATRCQAEFPVTTIQSELSVWSRDWLPDVVPWCRDHGVGFLAYAPLGRGFLAGSHAGDHRFGPDDFRTRLPRFTPDAVTANQHLVAVVREVASRHDATPAQVALAWVLDRAPNVVPIPGTRRASRVRENAAAASLQLDDHDRRTARRVACARRFPILSG